jgi:DNA helicase MCM8
MEQGEVAVAKGGLVAALPARAAVLAAANPAGGAYRRGATLVENLRMSPALLSRFDLVFLLLDRPDAERDARLTEHVMRARAGLAPRPPPALLEGPAPAAAGAPRPPLMDRLREARADDEPLPPVLLRKYIAYARQYVHPRLDAKAAAVLKRFYLRLRAAAAADAGALPVTHRALESLVRLTEARARAELRERVTAEDAEDAVAVVAETLDCLAAAGVGLADFGDGRGGGGAAAAAGGRGAQAERRRFVAALRAHCAAKGDAALPAHELYAVADRIELAVPDTGAFLEALREAGDLLKRGPGAFELAGFAPPGGGAGGGGGGGRRPLESSNGGGDAGGGGYGGW